MHFEIVKECFITSLQILIYLKESLYEIKLKFSHFELLLVRKYLFSFSSTSHRAHRAEKQTFNLSPPESNFNSSKDDRILIVFCKKACLKVKKVAEFFFVWSLSKEMPGCHLSFAFLQTAIILGRIMLRFSSANLYSSAFVETIWI